MSLACEICQAYHGHNDEEHFDHYQREIRLLKERVNLLSEVVMAYAMDKPKVAIDAINRLMDLADEENDNRF